MVMANTKRMIDGAIEAEMFVKRSKMMIVEDSDSDDEILLELITLVLKKNQPTRIKLYVERTCAQYNEIEFQQHFRMSRGAFEFLQQQFSNYILENDMIVTTSIEKQLLSITWILANQESYRSVGDRFDLAKSSLSMIFYRVVEFLVAISSQIIKFPMGREKQEIIRHFKRKKKFDGVIGAIDGAYINVKAPKGQKAAYTNRKCGQSVTLQAICDHKKRFLDVFIGFPSSVHDNRIFRNSPFFRESSKFFENGQKILRDKAYPVMPWCIPPYIDRGNLSNKQKYFNKKHSSLRIVVENSFALLFGRLRRLRHIDLNKPEYYPSVIVAACVIHNICINFGDQIDENVYLNEGAAFAQRCIPNESETTIATTLPDRSGITERDRMANKIWDSYRRPRS